MMKSVSVKSIIAVIIKKKKKIKKTDLISKKFILIGNKR